MSSSYPYELEICRLGTDVDSTARDETLHSFGRSAPQPSSRSIPAHTCIVEKRLDPRTALAGLTLEIWVRRWRTVGPPGDHRPVRRTESRAASDCSSTKTGRSAFILGDRRRVSRANLHTTATWAAHDGDQSAGAQDFRGQHAELGASKPVASRGGAALDGESKQVWVDGGEVASWKSHGPIRPGDAPLRIGAAGKDGLADFLLDADIAMPAIYARALSADEIAARYRSTGALAARRCCVARLLAAR